MGYLCSLWDFYSFPVYMVWASRLIYVPGIRSEPYLYSWYNFCSLPMFLVGCLFGAVFSGMVLGLPLFLVWVLWPSSSPGIWSAAYMYSWYNFCSLPVFLVWCPRVTCILWYDVFGLSVFSGMVFGLPVFLVWYLSPEFDDVIYRIQAHKHSHPNHGTRKIYIYFCLLLK